MSVCATDAATREVAAWSDLLESPAKPRQTERRARRRVPFCYRFRLTPLDGGAEGAPAILVTGRDLSPRGFGFEHTAPLPFRRVRLTGDDPRLGEISLSGVTIDLVLRWCRFLSPGVYHSGGRITQSNFRLE
ncbi:hypothetical protein [Botrimarina sp.]|uniref:hypothetical protein n=1 Tax=Botrimarina sp. TaxID=2795802 RepID=UPI0032EEB079